MIHMVRSGSRWTTCLVTANVPGAITASRAEAAAITEAAGHLMTSTTPGPVQGEVQVVVVGSLEREHKGNLPTEKAIMPVILAEKTQTTATMVDIAADNKIVVVVELMRGGRRGRISMMTPL